ncbi:MAG: hypothetical protein JO089_02715, partial [Alphaproteobacteria bacterium]|nr:hypothetical protein [Alphaproteobacteria bacterium]
MSLSTPPATVESAPAADPKNLPPQVIQGILEQAKKLLPEEMYNRMKFDGDFARKVIEMTLADKPPPERSGITGFIGNTWDGVKNFFTGGIFSTIGSSAAVAGVTYGLGRLAPKIMGVDVPADSSYGDHAKSVVLAERYGFMSFGIGSLISAVTAIFTSGKQYDEKRKIWYAMHGQMNPDLAGAGQTQVTDAGFPQNFNSGLPQLTGPQTQQQPR